MKTGLPTTWPSRGGEIEIQKMETSHIQNCLRVLYRAGHIEESCFNFYMVCEPSSPDWHWEAEARDILSRKPNAYIDAFFEELKKRGEPCDEEALMGSWPEADPYLYRKRESSPQ